MPDQEKLNQAANNIASPVDPVIAARQNARNQGPNYTSARSVLSSKNPDIIINGNKNPTSSVLRYPTDLGKYYITFTFSKYQRPSQFAPLKFLPAGATLALPVPANLVDSYNLTYSTQASGPAADAATAAARGTISQDQASQTAGGTDVLSLASDVFGAKLAGLLGGTGGQAALQYQGLASNPFLTVLFQQVEFKTHSFKWKFMPETFQESIALKEIIDQFRKSSLPGFTGSLFTVPDIVIPKLYPNDAYLYEFKPCVVKSISFNYAPNTPSFFASSNAPTGIEFSVELQEIEIWTQDNITSSTAVNATNAAYNKKSPAPAFEEIPPTYTTQGS
jgi:hypothetical protein